MSKQSMLRSAIMMLCLLATLFNCSSDDDDAKSNINPKYRLALALEPKWVSERIGDGMLSDQVVIDKGIYNNATVYIYLTCCVACDYIPVVYDKDGNRLEITLDQVTARELLYKGTGCEPVSIQ